LNRFTEIHKKEGDMEKCRVCKKVLSGSEYDEEKTWTICDRCQKELRAIDIRYGNGYEVHMRAKVKE